MRNLLKALLGAAMVACLIPMSAAPIGEDAAKTMVGNWLRMGGHTRFHGKQGAVAAVKPFFKDDGAASYYAVELEPTGFVIVPADDEMEPIVAFAEKGRYDPSKENPLGALITSDMEGRWNTLAAEMANAVNQNPQLARQNHVALSKAKWIALSITQDSGREGKSSLSDIRVGPLLKTAWSQTGIDGDKTKACYNYYTPTDGKNWIAGDTENYPCGCVSTATSQLIRYHEYQPENGIGQKEFEVEVNGVAQKRTTRGGDGNGGKYDWNLMPFDPAEVEPSDAERQMIGALTYDVGVASKMDYKKEMSGAWTKDACGTLKNVFGYSQAFFYQFLPRPSMFVPSQNLLDSNLDAGFPMVFEVSPNDPHEVVCDGYGYDSGTLYHHINVGWGGKCDAWYALPVIDDGYKWSTVSAVIFNASPELEDKGEIISGRVLDAAGAPVPQALVTATYDSGEESAITDAKGIYALTGLPSSRTCKITCDKSSVVRFVSTGTSADTEGDEILCGNVWGVDFNNNELDFFAIVSTAGPSGAVSPSGTAIVPKGGSQTFTFIPSEGYGIKDVQIDGVSAGRMSSHTFSNVTATHRISVTFSQEYFDSGSKFNLRASDLGIETFTEFSVKPQIVAYYTDPTRKTQKQFLMKVLTSTYPVDGVDVLCASSVLLYNKVDYKGKALGETLKNNPINNLPIMLTAGSTELKPAVPVIGAYYLASPILDSIVGPLTAGTVFTIKGYCFGNKPPIVLVELNVRGVYKYKKCKIQENTQDKDGVYSVKAVYPVLKSTETPTNYIIFQNSTSMASILFKDQ